MGCGTGALWDFRNWSIGNKYEYIPVCIEVLTGIGIGYLDATAICINIYSRVLL